MSGYFIVDRREWDVPSLIGPFDDSEAAEDYAASNYPDDEHGNVWILQASPPLGDEDTIEPHPYAGTMPPP